MRDNPNASTFPNSGEYKVTRIIYLTPTPPGAPGATKPATQATEKKPNKLIPVQSNVYFPKHTQ